MNHNKNDIFITKPFLPPLEDLASGLESLWDSRILSNNGRNHKEFELKLCDELDSPYVSLFSNCTIALMVAIKALDIKGDVLTSPFSFPASVSSLLWNNLNPIFCDIDYKTFNLDPKLIESSLTKNTQAILAVHAFGYPCQIDEISCIANQYSLKVIYDGAAAYGSKYKHKSVLSYGDLSVVSFHATKILNTFEGGAICCKSLSLKNKIDSIKNFGFNNLNNIDYIGINGKMNEFSSLLGLKQLKYFSDICQKRTEIRDIYNSFFSKLNLIEIPKILFDDDYNNTYYPILISPKSKYSRDEILSILLEKNIYARKYYHPLLSEVQCFVNESKSYKLPIAEDISERIICLPIYPSLSFVEQERIINQLRKILPKA